MRHLTAAAKMRITNTFTFGTNPRRESKVEDYDGVMAVHACVSCWKQTSTAYRQTIIDTLYSSPSCFLKEWPADVTASLRKLTTRADVHCIPLQWEALGAKIVTYVSGRDPVFAQNLAQFGPSGAAYAAHRDLNDSAALTDQLFSVIDTCCQEVKAVETSKGANSIRISWKSSRTLGRSDPGDSIAAMANDVIDSFLVNFAVSNSLNTNHERIV